MFCYQPKTHILKLKQAFLKWKLKKKHRVKAIRKRIRPSNLKRQGTTRHPLWSPQRRIEEEKITCEWTANFFLHKLRWSEEMINRKESFFVFVLEVWINFECEFSSAMFFSLHGDLSGIKKFYSRLPAPLKCDVKFL